MNKKLIGGLIIGGLMALAIIGLCSEEKTDKTPTKIPEIFKKAFGEK